jgi:hypothetical protein
VDSYYFLCIYKLSCEESIVIIVLEPENIDLFGCNRLFIIYYYVIHSVIIIFLIGKYILLL